MPPEISTGHVNQDSRQGDATGCNQILGTQVGSNFAL